MSEISGLEAPTQRQRPRELEGFHRPLNVPEGEALTCSTCFIAHDVNIADFRGPLPGKARATRDRRAVEWETSPAHAAEPTAFTWIGGSLVRPVRDAYPYVLARLSVDGVPRITFPLGWLEPLDILENGFRLTFEPRRFQSLVEHPHRVFDPHGISGFYRLEAPASHVTAGKSLRLRVDLLEPPEGSHSFFYVSSRRDALGVAVETMREELAQVQRDLVQLRRSHELLFAQQYKHLFPNLIGGERLVVHQDPTLHYHPPAITRMRDGEVVITTREATDHLALDGHIVAWRSRDGGRAWSQKETWLNVPRADHRSSPVIELSSGEWLLSDYRAGHLYNAEGVFDEGYTSGPTLWSAWSSDRGRTWSYSKDPILVPGADPYGEAERHMIELPNGRILMAANFVATIGAKPDHYSVAIHASDDRGRTWRVIGKVPENPLIIGEPTLVRTASGRIVLLMRTQRLSGAPFAPRGPLLQTVSTDDGATWSAPEPTAMSSMASPAHLLTLRDGRLLCTHGSRHHPASIYVTVSRDEGRTWDTANTRIVTNDMPGDDSCYPTSAQLTDGTILTTWYMNLFGKFAVMLARYGEAEVG